MTNILLPENAGVLVRPPSRIRDVQTAGPFYVGRRFPLCGVSLVVTKILENEEGQVKLVFEPIGLTRGEVKRMAGKKGKKHARRAAGQLRTSGVVGT